MQILTYRSDRGPRAGLLVDGAVVDAWDALGGDGSSVRELLEADRLGELSGIDAGGGVTLEDVELLPPVPDPEKIVCIGLNYRAHAAEAGIDPPDAPAIFGKYRNALVPTGAAVRLPAASDKVDYEAEVAFVIGRRYLPFSLTVHMWTLCSRVALLTTTLSSGSQLPILQA